MDEHHKWLSRRTYHEAFSTPDKSLFNWRGLPNRCKCGCGKIWYDRVSPVNWWKYFDPTLLIRLRFLFPLFRPLYELLWHSPPVIWIAYQNAHSGYKEEVRARVKLGSSIRAATFVAGFLVYGILTPIIVAMYAGTWFLSRVGGVAILVLHGLCLALLLALLLTLLAFAIIAISMRGIVFVIGGAASVAYSYYPIIGIGLIVVGLLLEYERYRRNELKREEQLGNMILLLRGASSKQ
jgi:uncharacterized protein with PQ loop repeat